MGTNLTATRTQARIAMAKPPSRYGIGAVVRLTGLSRHVIRVWERRHGAINPERAPSGFRLFGEAEIERLKLLRQAVDAGHRISAIAGLVDQEIKALLPEIKSNDMASILERMLDATRNFDRPGLEQLLTREALALGPFDFCRLVVGPLLDHIGDACSDTESRMAGEHMAFATIKGILMSLLRFQSDTGGGPTMLFSTLPGERHEFGALMAAVCAQQTGARVIYLGPDLSLRELSAAAQRSHSDIIVLSAANAISEAAFADLEELRLTLPRHVDIWVGGRGWRDEKLPADVRVLATLDDLRQQVHRYANKA